MRTMGGAGSTRDAPASQGCSEFLFCGRGRSNLTDRNHATNPVRARPIQVGPKTWSRCNATVIGADDIGLESPGRHDRPQRDARMTDLSTSEGSIAPSRPSAAPNLPLFFALAPHAKPTRRARESGGQAKTDPPRLPIGSVPGPAPCPPCVGVPRRHSCCRIDLHPVRVDTAPCCLYSVATPPPLRGEEH
jgi:hypothetical protein